MTISTLILNCDIHHVHPVFNIISVMVKLLLKVISTLFLAQQSCAGAAFEILAALLELSVMVLI